MTDPERHEEPLIRAPSQENNVVRGPSSRAYKVAGFTLLACLLVAGQALTAYFVLGQRSDIKSLEEQNKGLREDIKRGRSAAPAQIHVPAAVMPKLIDYTVNDKEASTGSPHADSLCQLEALGVVPPRVRLPGFRPRCDEGGLFEAEQCWLASRCWCVDPVSGTEIPGTQTTGAAQCHRQFAAAGSGHRMMVLPDNTQLQDE